MLIKERWKDLSSLNDPDMRFQMADAALLATSLSWTELATPGSSERASSSLQSDRSEHSLLTFHNQRNWGAL